MKTKGKKLMALVLTISLCMSNMVIVSADRETEHVDGIDSMDSLDNIGALNGMVRNTATEGDCDVKIQHQITSRWDNHYNVDVTLENMTDERIDNWEICIPANYEIENIWNAKVTDYTDGEYTIHNAEWNQDIAVGGSVSFGMMVSCSEELEMPEYVYTLGLSELLDEKEYKIEFKKHSQWDGKFNGQIIITNLSEKTIEDWNMFFVCNFEIDQIWNAVVEENFWEEDLNYCDIENPGYNQNIAPNQSVEFGFIAAVDGEPEVSEMELFKITSDLDFSDDDDEDESDYDEDWFRKDSDYFETREEYEQYLEENGYTDDALMDLDEPAGDSRSKRSSKKAKKEIPCLGVDLNVKRRVLPTQHYMPLPNGASYLMKSKDDSNAYVFKRTIGADEKVSYSTGAEFEGFAHGQTFEQFVNSNHEEYYLLGCGAKGKFARKLAIIPRSIFENRVLSGKKIAFEDWEEGLFRILTGLQYANKERSGKGKGKLYRVDAALTADGSTIAIWKEFQKEKNNKKELFHEISLYDMWKISEIYQKEWESAEKKNKNKSLRLSFNKKKKALKKALIGSFGEKFTSERKSVLKPNGSFQSIDIEKYIEDNAEKWRIVITSGNEIGDTKDATITRLEVEREKEKGKGIIYEAFRDDIGFDGEPNAKLELEGGHIMNGNSYEFLVVKRVKVTGKDGKEKNPRHLFLATIDLRDIKTKV